MSHENTPEEDEWTRQFFVDLFADEIDCDRCDGSGEIWGVWSEEHRRLVNVVCPDCGDRR